MVLELCGGEASDMVVAGDVPDTSRSYKLNPSRVVSLVGMEIAEAEQVRILETLGFAVDNLNVSVPSWRPDGAQAARCGQAGINGGAKAVDGAAPCAGAGVKRVRDLQLY